MVDIFLIIREKRLKESKYVDRRPFLEIPPPQPILKSQKIKKHEEPKRVIVIDL